MERETTFSNFQEEKEEEEKKQEKSPFIWILEGKGGEEIVGVRRSRRGARREGMCSVFFVILENLEIRCFGGCSVFCSKNA